MAIAESPVADAIFEALGKDSIQYLADHFVFHRIAFYLLAVGPAEGGGIVGDLGGGKVSGDVACLKSVEGEQLAHLFGTAISGIGLYTIHGLGGEASEGGAHLFGTLCHADGLPCSHRANRDVVDEKSEKAFRHRQVDCMEEAGIRKDEEVQDGTVLPGVHTDNVRSYMEL